MRALLLRQVRNYYPKNPSNRVLCLSSDETYEYVKRLVDAEQAVMIAKRLTESVGARIGTTRRIIITDGGDYTVFEWSSARASRFHKGSGE